MNTLLKASILHIWIISPVTSFADNVWNDVNNTLWWTSITSKTQEIKWVWNIYTEINWVKLDSDLDKAIISTAKAIWEQVDKIVPKNINFKASQDSNWKIELQIRYKINF